MVIVVEFVGNRRFLLICFIISGSRNLLLYWVIFVICSRHYQFFWDRKHLLNRQCCSTWLIDVFHCIFNPLLQIGRLNNACSIQSLRGSCTRSKLIEYSRTQSFKDGNHIGIAEPPAERRTKSWSSNSVMKIQLYVLFGLWTSTLCFMLYVLPSWTVCIENTTRREFRLR